MMIEASLPSSHSPLAVTVSVSSLRSIRIVSVDDDRQFVGSWPIVFVSFYLIFCGVFLAGASAWIRFLFCSASLSFVYFFSLLDILWDWYVRWCDYSVTNFGKGHGGYTCGLLDPPEAGWFLLGWLLVLLLGLLPDFSYFQG